MFTSPERRATDSIKWRRFPQDVLPLWVADMDFTSPPAVMAALHQRVDHGVFGYANESDPLKNLIVERMQQRYGWKISKDAVMLIPGVIAGLNLSAHAVVKPGESILIQPPIYPPFFEVPGNCGTRTVMSAVKLSESGTYEVDFEDFEQRIESDTRLFLLCNPHNPVGRVYIPEELSRMAEICLRHDLLICSDEIHSDLIFSGYKHTPIASLSDEISARTITLIAPSKTFNIAGLDCAALICTNPDLMQRLKKASQGLMGGVNLLGAVAAEAAYRDGAEWLAEILQLLESNRDYLLEYIRQEMPAISMTCPQATYLAWLDCSKLDLAESPGEFFVKQARVGLNPGIDFGEVGRNHVRLNFGTSRETLETALDRMADALRRR